MSTAEASKSLNARLTGRNMQNTQQQQQQELAQRVSQVIYTIYTDFQGIQYIIPFKRSMRKNMKKMRISCGEGIDKMTLFVLEEH